jgi:hypothetical protein
MPSPVPTLQPALSSVYSNYTETGPSAWLTYQLSGVPCPGTIPPGGIHGFERETGWDEKAGKGTMGATLTLKTRPPCRGSITSQLFTPQDFTEWDAFVRAVLSIDSGAQQADGLSIQYPGFSSIGLTVVVVKHWTPIMHVGDGLYQVTVSLIEWSPPPAVSIVATVASTSEDDDVDAGRFAKVNPHAAQNAANQARIAAASAGAAAAAPFAPPSLPVGAPSP